MMIVLDACEAFFLRGGDDLAVNDEAGGGVVIERRDSENTYHRKSEEGIDEWRDCRAFGKHQQHADRDERDQDRSEPELLVLPHELPQLANDVKFRHADQKLSPAPAQRRSEKTHYRCAVAPLREKNSVHLLIVLRIFLSLWIRLPEGLA